MLYGGEVTIRFILSFLRERIKSILSAHSIVYIGFDENGITFCAELFMQECSHFIPFVASATAHESELDKSAFATAVCTALG